MNLTSRDHSDLLRVAQAIADGTEVDWCDASLSRDSLRERLERMRIVEKIRGVHRSGSAPEMPLRQTVSDPPRPAGDPSRSSEAPATWGTLQILERIGCGGYGEVFRAHDPALQKDVALKLLYAAGGTNADGEDFLDEGRRLAAVRHPNVLTVHGAAQHDGRVGLWTDLVEGQTLEQVLGTQGLLGHKEAAVIGLDLCRALAAVHGAGMVHGDVKAGNVMREAGSGNIVLMDFSSVRQRRAAVGEAGPLCGTPIYMAPELLRGRDAGVASDVYSLGVLLYRLVTARFPFEAGSIRELLDKMSQGKMLPLREVRPDLPRQFIQVVERALALDPEERYHGVADMERDLSRILQRRPLRPPVINFWRLAAAVAVIGVLVLLRVVMQPFSVEASIYRSNGIGERVLAEGARVSPGDTLFLEVESNKRMHVYVINSSQPDEYVALFPMSEFDLQNPLPAGKHRLPGSVNGAPRDWAVGASSHGQETILVVASLSPLQELEESMERMLHAEARERPGRLPGDRRSIDSHVPSPDAQELKEILSFLASENRGEPSDVWIWERRLSNPDPL